MNRSVSIAVGITVVGMNAWWTAEEMAYALEDSDPAVLFLDSERLARVRQKPDMLQGTKLVGVRLDDVPGDVIDWKDVIATGGNLPDVTVDPDSDACIFYTSGTTGFPKGAQLTHRGCVANLFNMLFAGASSAPKWIGHGPALMREGPQP